MDGLLLTISAAKIAILKTSILYYILKRGTDG